MLAAHASRIMACYSSCRYQVYASTFVSNESVHERFACMHATAAFARLCKPSLTNSLPAGMQPVCTKELVAVHGGHLQGATKYKAMLLETTEVEGKRAFTVDRKDIRMSRFLGDDFAMVDFLIGERNSLVQAQVANDPERDPMGCDQEVPAPSSKRQRLECVNEADSKWLEIDVEGKRVSVLATWDVRNMLTLEYSTENLAVLLQSPPETSPFPILGHPKVHWYAPNNMLWAWFYDATEEKWRRKTASVKPRATKQELQDAIDQAANDMLEWIRLRDSSFDADDEDGHEDGLEGAAVPIDEVEVIG